MKLHEVALLIGYISGTDNRQTDNPYAVKAWHDALEPYVTLDDAKAAVVDHRRNAGGVYLEVGHINAYVKRLRRQRVAQNQTPPVIPADLHQAQERAWVLSFWDAVKLGVADPNRAADEALSITRRDDPLILDAGVSGQIRAFGNAKAIR